MIGHSITRPDTIEKVTGKARFAGDFSVPDALHMKLRFAERPHARILSIDTNRALKHPGVVAVFTAEDVPFNKYGLMSEDQPVLCDEVVRFVGDQVAAVVAETPQQAAQAAALIDIEYRELPIMSTPEQAMSAEAPTLHADFPGNIAGTIRLRRGDTRPAFENAAVIYENEYHTPMQEHVYMELEAGFAYIGEQGEIIVRTAGQSVHEDQRQIAKALSLPLEQVRVIYGPVGGAFGGREDLSIQIVIALATWKLKRPVQIHWNRSESICGHGKRHATRIRHRWAADENGRITAAEVEILIDAGAYAYTSNSVLEGMLSTCIGPYDIPNVTVEGNAVFTNNVPGAAFRGYGTPQTGFAAELHITHMAELLGIDPITMRSRNCLRDDSLLPTQTPFPGESSLAELIDICARESGCQKTQQGWKMPAFEKHSNRRRGFGLAAGMKATGYGYGFPEGSEAKIVLHGGASIERAELYTAAVEVGQGAHTVLVQIAAHVLGIPMEHIELFPSDTLLCGDGGSASASRLTYVAGNAIKSAAEMALQAWHDETRPAVGEAHWSAPATTAPDLVTGACIDNISYSFAVQGVTVEVDMETGIIHLDKVIAVQDVGRAINPKKIEGQIEGSIAQAMGWALLENFVTANGFVLSNTLSTYLVPTSLDTPRQVKSVQIERPDPNGPFGVRGVGEVPFIPLAPAIIMAIKDAIGVWFNHIPVKSEEVIVKIKENNQL